MACGLHPLILARTLCAQKWRLTKKLRRQTLLVRGCGRGGRLALREAEPRGGVLPLLLEGRLSCPCTSPQGWQRPSLPRPGKTQPVECWFQLSPQHPQHLGGRRAPQLAVRDEGRWSWGRAGSRAGLSRSRLNQALLGPVTEAHLCQITLSLAFPVRVVGREEGGL